MNGPPVFMAITLPSISPVQNPRLLLPGFETVEACQQAIPQIERLYGVTNKWHPIYPLEPAKPDEFVKAKAECVALPAR